MDEQTAVVDPSTMEKKGFKTIYVDLDGTLAHYDGWKSPEDIGKPIAPMLRRVNAWLLKGHQVKIFTARLPQHWHFVSDWLKEYGLPPLEITNVKGIDGTEFWDDRAVSVECNTGMYAHADGARKLANINEERVNELQAKRKTLENECDALRFERNETAKALKEAHARIAELEADNARMGDRELLGAYNQLEKAHESLKEEIEQWKKATGATAPKGAEEIYRCMDQDKEMWKARASEQKTKSGADYLRYLADALDAVGARKK